MKGKSFPTISRPCSQDWQAMQGDDKRRFCDQCQLHVHNLSAMSRAEQEALLSERKMRQCIAYLTPDRSIRVRTSSWMILQRLLRPWRAGLALIAMLLPFAFSGCATTRSSTPAPVETHDCKQVQGLPDEKMVLGGLLYTPPFWRRVLFFWE